VRDLAIAVSNTWLAAFDNLSSVVPWFSDCLCRLSTGAGFATRELYSDRGEVIITAQRPVVVNGIEEIVTRPDLLSRSIIIHLPEIDPGDRRDERTFWSDFETIRPALLGAIFTRSPRRCAAVTPSTSTARRAWRTSPDSSSRARPRSDLSPASSWRPTRRTSPPARPGP